MERSDLRERLILDNLGLVRMVAARLSDGRSDPEDLIQYGQIGLIQAADRYDSAYGASFSSYAVPYITGEIRRYLRENRPVKCSREFGRLCGIVRRYQQEAENKNGRAPTLEELCRALSLDRETLLLALNTSAPVSSLETPLSGEEEGFCLADTLAASPPTTPLEDRLDLSDSIRALPESERRLIELRYYKNLTQTETAKRLGLSQIQVCRMEKRILLTLRQKIR